MERKISTLRKTEQISWQAKQWPNLQFSKISFYPIHVDIIRKKQQKAIIHENLIYDIHKTLPKLAKERLQIKHKTKEK